MTDLFAVLGQPRRPLLDEALLKDEYFRQAAQLHPDASAGDTEKFRLLQEAFQTLGDPASRLRHLQELEYPSVAAAPMQGDLFMRVGQSVQAAQSVLQRSEKTQTPLAKALLLGDMATARTELKETLAAVDQCRSALLSEVTALDAHWPSSDGVELNRLASALAFVSRWHSQLAEWEFRLSHN